MADQHLHLFLQAVLYMPQLVVEVARVLLVVMEQLPFLVPQEVLAVQEQVHHYLVSQQLMQVAVVAVDQLLEQMVLVVQVVVEMEAE
jgi:hypothetical protein